MIEIIIIVAVIGIAFNYRHLWKQQKRFTDFWYEDSKFWKEAYLDLWQAWRNEQNDEGEEWKRQD